MIRQPIIAVLGHVDHGKTTLLDKIRGTAVQAKEVGGITQQIGATEIPINTIKTICMEGKDFKIPGILIIDTPGHAAFTSIRERGGSIADLAVLVIDVNEGIQQQTRESIRILKSFKVPFVIACNKIDKFPLWHSKKTTSFTESFKKQNSQVQENFKLRLYSLIGELSNEGFSSALFSEIDDYTRTIAIIPTSGITGEGISELLMLLVGLSQKFLEKKLEINPQSDGKGTVLEVKELTGLGRTIDVILYDGQMRVNDTLIIAGMDQPIITKIKAILKPAPLTELRQTKKYDSIKSISAAAGIKISAPCLEAVIPGMPLISTCKNPDKAIGQLKERIQKLTVKMSDTGVIIRANSVGAVEAIIKILEEKGIPIKKASVGRVIKEDVTEAVTVKQANPYLGVIFAFNVTITETAQELINKEKIKIFEGNIIYHLLEQYEMWKDLFKKQSEKEIFEKTVTPAKLQIKSKCIFRQFNPCIVGVEIIGGKLRTNIPLMNCEGKNLGKIKGMEKSNEKISEARKGEELAICIEKAKYERDFGECDYLYSNISEHDYKIIQEYLHFLSNDEKEILDEIIKIKRKENRLWGMI